MDARVEGCCPLCGSTDGLARARGGNLLLAKCRCGMVFQAPLPPPKELMEIYRSDYYRSWGFLGEGGKGPGAAKIRTFEACLARLSSRLKGGTLLDVGCATGLFLEAAEAAGGWEVHGVEISAFAASVARKKFGDRIFHGALEQARYPAGMFDLVTMSDLIEHVPAPLPLLDEVRRVLKPGGHLMIVTPDLGSLSARMMGGRWAHYHREHVCYYTRQTIRVLLEGAGFTDIEVEAAVKYLNLSYIAGQLRAYPHSLLTPLAQGLERLLPRRLKEWCFPLRCGELLVLAQRGGHGPAEDRGGRGR